MAQIHFGTRSFDAELVIFDKDGTLIDFTGLWSHYTTGAVEGLMTALAAAPNADAQSLAEVRADLYASLGYNPVDNSFDPQSPIVTAPLPTLYTLAAGVLYRHGWAWLDAELEVERSFAPHTLAPLPREMVKSTADLPALFGALTRAGITIAVITSDDRAPTLAALTWLEVSDQVTFIACADDGYAYKPAPEAVLAACDATGISLARTVMVGDSTTDLLMGERAGVGLRVAVLTGTMDTATLSPLADVVLASIGEIRVESS